MGSYEPPETGYEPSEIVPPRAVSAAKTIHSAEVHYTIVRACVKCGHARTVGTPCEGCGNDDAPLTDELGVVSATYRNPAKWIWRHFVGGPLAQHRIRKANKRTAHLRSSVEKS